MDWECLHQSLESWIALDIAAHSLPNGVSMADPLAID